ncbi:MAG TPA: energy transducer TonB [Vicinamibacterales bacterium]|nr:energy transducer TonB [Vicinamibacterales bacterium]
MRITLAIAALSILVSAPALAQSGTDPVYPVGNGVMAPVPVKEVQPNYTKEAMRRMVQGMVELSTVVLTDGTVGEVRVTKPLDQDLDQEAIKAVKQWQFKPGTKDGKPVNVRVVLELTFTLREGSPVYRAGKEVSAPVLIKEVKPDYPESARQSGVHGTVEMEGIVGVDGAITGIRVTKSLDERLDQEAMKALAQWTFKPGEKDGAPVRVWVNIEMTFTVK